MISLARCEDWWPVCVVTGPGRGGWRVCQAEKLIHLSEIPIQMSGNFGWKISPVPFLQSHTIWFRLFVRGGWMSDKSKPKWNKELFEGVTHLCTSCWIFSWEWEMRPLRSCSVMTETSGCPVTPATESQNCHECPHVTCHQSGAIHILDWIDNILHLYPQISMSCDVLYVPAH